MYRVLYRKWRPAAFSDVVGQSHITDTLRHEVESGRLAHAYLFTGSRGTGKTTCAKILAKAVNCLSPKEGDPCNECEVCRGIDNGSILDVVEIDAASNNGVDNIRDLRQEANFTPAVGKYRVYIIDEVHMLSTGAFNALLKTLEEPPQHVVFVLATTEVHKLPATILSRCQRFDFMRISTEHIAQRLLYVAEEEKFSLTPEAARLIGRLADGGMRDALSMLDQCAGVAGEEEISAQVVSRVVGLAGRDHLFQLSTAIRDRDTASALECIDRLHASSKDMERLCEELVAHFRNIMLVKTVKDPGDLLTCADSELDRLREEAEHFTLAAVLSALRSLQDTLDRLRSGASRRMEMEMLFLRLTTPSLEDSNEALLRRLSDLEAAVRALSAGGVPAVSVPKPVESQESVSVARAEAAAQRYRLESLEEPTPQAEPEEVPLPEPPEQSAPLPSVSPAPAPGEVPPSGPVPFGEWPDVVAALNRKNPLMASVLRGSSAYLQGDLLLIDSRNAQFLDLIREGAKNRGDIREAALEITGRQFRLGPYRKEEKASAEDPFAAFVSRLQGSSARIEKTDE